MAQDNTQRDYYRTLDEQDELERIMRETYTNNDYVDQQIADLLQSRTKAMTPLEERTSRSDSNNSFDVQKILPVETDGPFYKQPEDQPEQESVAQPVPASILQRIESEQCSNYEPCPYSEVEMRYNLHLLKQEDRAKLNDNYACYVPNHINSFIKKSRKAVVGSEVYFENQERTVAVWTREGEVILFYPMSQRTATLRPFEGEIATARISQDLQYMAVASASMELCVYRVREQISIENKKTFRFLPQPTILYTVTPKQLTCNIAQIEFIPSNDSVEMVVLDEFDEVSSISIRKKLLSLKCQIAPLEIVFQTVFMIKTSTVQCENGPATVLAVSSQQAVTLCLLKPHFELIFVYQQSNRENLIKQGRIPHIDFDRNKLLILWDKYLQVVSIELQDTKPLTFDIRTLSHYFLAENSIAVGFLSDTLVYQFSRSGLRAYSINKFPKGNYKGSRNASLASAEIFSVDLNLDLYPESSKLTSDLLNNPQPPLAELRRFHNGVSTTLRNKCSAIPLPTHNSLIYIYNSQIESLQFIPYSEYLSRIDSEGHWKLCLGVLKGLYEGTICQLDCIRVQLDDPEDPNLKKLIVESQDYVQRYLQRLFSLISAEKKALNWNQSDIQNQQMLFVCDFLIRTGNCKFMMEEVATRCVANGLHFFKSLEPFILLKRVADIGKLNIDLVFSNFPQNVLSKLVYSLDPEINELYLIKPILIKKHLLQQFLYLSVLQEDYYTPFVILLSYYKESKQRSILELLLYYLKKSILGHKLPEGLHSPATHKLILKEVLLKFLVREVYRVLIVEAHQLLFGEVLPELFSQRTLPRVNELEYDDEIVEELRTMDIESDIIKNVIIRGIPRPDPDDQWLGDYWKFVLDLFVRSLLVDYSIMNGLHQVLAEKLISPEFVVKIIKKPEFSRQLATYPKIDSLLECLVGSDYTQLRIMLLLLKKDYIAATRLLLSCSRTNTTIFDHLNTTMPLIPSSDLLPMENLLKSQIKFLVEEDTEQLRQILTKYFAGEQRGFIGVLEPYPQLQLALTSAVLGNSCDDKDLRVEYLKLLTKLGRFSVVQAQIFKDLYPLDQSLQICREYGLHRAEAYLYERLGDVNKSIRMHFVVINEILDAFDKKYYEEREIQGILLALLEPSIESCVRICKTVSQRGEYEYQMHWFVIVQQLQRTKMKTRNYFLAIRSTINAHIYPKIFQQIITNVQLTSIIRYIEQNLNRLQFNTIRDSFSLLIKAYSYQKEMLYKCKDLMHESVDNTRYELLQEYKKGFSTTGQCSMCSGDEDILIRYPCGHQIHPYCTQDMKICTICVLEDESFKVAQIVTKQEIGFSLLKAPFIPRPEQTQKKPRRNLLIEYDYRHGDLTEDMKSQIQAMQ